MYACDCPVSGALPSLGIENCPFEFGQLQKIILTRLVGENGMAKVDDANLKASWTALIAKTDSDKVIVTPFVYNPLITPGDFNVTGENSNETPNGEGVIIGENATVVTGNFSKQPPAVIKALRSLSCENLGAYFVTGDGRIWGQDNNSGSGSSATENNIKPFPVRAWRVKGYDAGTLDAPTKNDFQFSMKPEWADNLTAVKPDDFDPLTEL